MSRCQGREERKLAYRVFADATDKEPRYDGGAEVIGVASGWKTPRNAAGTSRPARYWLLAAPRDARAKETRSSLTLAGDMTVAAALSHEPVRRARSAARRLMRT